MTRKRQGVFAAALTLGTAGACLLGAEITVRLLWSSSHPKQPTRWRGDAGVGLVHVPGHYQLPFHRCLFGAPACEDVRVTLTVNRAGFRSPEFRNPAGHPLIAVVGDSFIEGAQVDDDKTACRVLQSLLLPTLPDAEVRNLGISSAGFAHYWARWQAYGAAMKPDLLIVAVFGLNDFRNCSPSLETFAAVRPRYEAGTNPGSLREVTFGSPRETRKVWYARGPLGRSEFVRFVRWRYAVHEEMSDSIGGALPRDYLVYENPPTAQFAEAIQLGKDFLSRLIADATARGTRVIVVYLPSRKEAIDDEWPEVVRLHADERQAASAHLERDRPEEIVRVCSTVAGADFLSFRDSASNLPVEVQKRLWHVRTDGHLSELGHRALAEALAPRVVVALGGGGSQ